MDPQPFVPAFVGCLLLALGPVAEAQVAEPLVGDRPDFTESPTSVAAGRVQLESGYTFSRVGGTKAHSLGELLFRVGLRSRLELRVAFNSFAVVEEGGRELSGLEDLSIGAKLVLLDAVSGFHLLHPQAALLIGTTVPLGSDELSDKEPQPEAKLALGWDLLPRLALSSNINVAYAGVGQERFTQLSGSVALGVVLLERLGGYLELYGFNREESGGPARHFLNGGLTLLLAPDVQLDARAGVGLDGIGPDYFFGFGSVLRL